MLKTLRSYTKIILNKVIRPMGFEIIRRERGFEDYINFKQTIADANMAGLNVGDYIESKSKVPGSAQKTIDKMKELGVFADRIQRVCEIGPGSGRYLEKTIIACNPEYYEIYETSTEWAKWLKKEYMIYCKPCDGKSLKDTPSLFIDLVQAHKLFNGLPFITTCRYMREMARVVKKGGKIVFDIFTEDCMDDVTLGKWLDEEIEKWDWIPSIMQKRYIINFFQKRDIRFVDSFFISLFPGKTECLVFKK